MKNLIILLSIIILFSCQSTNSMQNNSYLCDSLNREMGINWKYSDEKLYFITSKEFTSKLKSNYKSCLLGLSKQKIIELFGNPTSSMEDKTLNDRFRYSFEYLISLPCIKVGMNNTRCYYFVFYFDSNDKLTELL